MCDLNSEHQQSLLVVFAYSVLVVDRITREIMPERCIVYGCSNTRDAKEGISLHFIPFPATREQKRKKKEKVDRFCFIESCES